VCGRRFLFHNKGDRAYERQPICTIDITREDTMKTSGPLLLTLFLLACSLTTPPSLPQDMSAQVSNITHLATATQDPDPILHTMPATCTVSAQSLHLRECAGLHCTVLAWLSTGDVLEVLDADQDWLNVTTPAGQTGWVHSKYCGGTQ
jgi:uncharacterized protein YgiM (DUF1202 family)